MWVLLFTSLVCGVEVCQYCWIYGPSGDYKFLFIPVNYMTYVIFKSKCNRMISAEDLFMLDYAGHQVYWLVQAYNALLASGYCVCIKREGVARSRQIWWEWLVFASLLCYLICIIQHWSLVKFICIFSCDMFRPAFTRLDNSKGRHCYGLHGARLQCWNDKVCPYNCSETSLVSFCWPRSGVKSSYQQICE